MELICSGTVLNGVERHRHASEENRSELLSKDGRRKSAEPMGVGTAEKGCAEAKCSEVA